MKLKTPYRDLVPPLSEEQKAALAADLKLRGQLAPVVIDEDGAILDGHNRYDVLKGKVETRVLAGLSEDEKKAFVFCSSMGRRNLSPEQRGEMRERMKPIAKSLRESDPKVWTQKKLAAVFGVSEATVSRWNLFGEANLSSNLQMQDTTKPDARTKLTPDDKRLVAEEVSSGKTQSQVAADFGVSQKTVSNVVKQAEETLAKAEAQEAKVRANMEAAKAWPLGDGSTWKVETCDVLDGLEEIRRAKCKARLIFTDPPYNIGIDYGQGESADLLPDDDYMAWVEEWLDLCREVLADDGSLWVMIGDEYAAEYGVALKRLGFTVRNWIKWYETFGVNCTGKFNRTSRHIFYCVRDPKHFVFDRTPVTRPSDRQTKYNDPRASEGGKVWDDVWQIPRLVGNSKERIPGFPTQLPLDLVRPIVECASETGDLVVDPFNGSGTTGAAAILTGRRYIGLELSDAFAEEARRRLSAVMQPETEATT